MQKNYAAPSIKAVDTLAFETVCAGSGAGQCVVNPGVRFSINIDSYNPCQSCFQEYHTGFFSTVAAMPGGNTSANRAQAIRNILAAGGTCPGGFTA